MFLVVEGVEDLVADPAEGDFRKVVVPTSFIIDDVVAGNFTFPTEGCDIAVVGSKAKTIRCVKWRIGKTYVGSPYQRL